jgi:ubiquinone/menaquinone biosynthesis C-methylase UbiE
MRKYPKFYQGLAQIVKKNISKKIKNPIIVDIGVGPGILTAEVKKKVPEAKIFGVDPSEKMLKAANKNVNSKDFQAMLGTSEKIPLQSNFADVVLSRFSLTYWKKPVDSFIEIKRVLKPGGRLVLEALNKDYSKLRLFITKIHMNFKLAGDDLIKYHVDAYKTAYRIQDVERILKKNGFKITFKDSVEKDWKFTIVAEKLKN